MHKKENLNSFLEEYPLYKPFEAVTEYKRTCEGYTDPFMLYGQTFNYLCPNENEQKVFSLTIPESFIEYWGKFPDDGIPDLLIDEDGKLNYIQHFEGKCTCCKISKIDFLLHIWSDNPIPQETIEVICHDPSSDPLKQNPVNIYIEKIGEYPIRKAIIDKEISKFFDRESNNWYYKAKKSLENNLGIGAFSYYRRILEKELLHILAEVGKLKNSHSSNINELIKEYKETNKVHLLYENVYEYLPLSLKALGDNPLKLLYKQISAGLHNLTEDECLKKSEAIDFVLTFVIRKLYEEKSEMKKAISLISELKR